MLLDTVAKERGYSALSNALDMGYCLLQIERDDVGRPVDYRFIDTNPLFELHTGLHDAIGRSALELVPDLEGFWIERYAQIAESGKSTRFVQRSRAMDRDFEVHAFPVGPAHDRMVGLLFKDLKEFKEAERREANRTFLSEVASVFDSNASLDKIMTSVGAKLGDYLAMNSCLFCHVDEHTDTITTSYGWTRAGEPNLVRTYRTSEYLNGRFLADSRARLNVVVDDTALDPRTDAAAYAALNIRAFVTVPYFSEGKWTHCFGVTSAHSRT